MDEYYYEIAVPTPLEGPFIYSYSHEIPDGCRVAIPFGARLLIGVTLKQAQKPSNITFTIKRIKEVIDTLPSFNPNLMKIADFMHRYYFYPHGEVFKTMLPAGTLKKDEKYVHISEKGKAEIENRSLTGAKLKQTFRGRRKIKYKTLIKNNIDLDSLKENGLIYIASSTRARPTTTVTTNKCEVRVQGEKQLTSAQLRVYRTISQSIDKSKTTKYQPKPFLLHGITGAGKTEIYMQLIRHCFDLNSHSQALVMVPEISLTPQMTRVFEARFQKAVSVVHSAMTNKNRWHALERIRSGEAQILIGPRSAVFATFNHLDLIIVDEEHDSSYKQSTGLCYNGRDIAVLRAQLEKAQIILGSATPSLESYQNALDQKYNLIELLERPGQQSLPKMQIINTLPQSYFGRHIVKQKLSLPVDKKILEALQQNIEKKEQSIVLVNRRGYSYYLFDIQTKKAISCPHCSISLTTHSKDSVLRCHYCSYNIPTTTIINKNEKRYLSVGYGSQQLEHFLQQELPNARIARVDSDTTQRKENLSTILSQFSHGKLDILIGTQILAKGHDYPKVTLTIVLEVDQVLNLPDFRAGERAFQLMVQAAGRAGRGGETGNVMIQTGRSDHNIIQAGLDQNYKQFSNIELSFRKRMGYPPFRRMISIELSATGKELLKEMSQQAENWVETETMKATAQEVQILGPTIPAIETIRGRSRRTIVFLSHSLQSLRTLVHKFLRDHNKYPRDGKVKVEVDPQSMI